jgi:hypothetical protein
MVCQDVSCTEPILCEGEFQFVLRLECVPIHKARDTVIKFHENQVVGSRVIP